MRWLTSTMLMVEMRRDEYRVVFVVERQAARRCTTLACLVQAANAGRARMDVDAEQVQVRDGWYVQPLSADAASTELTSVQCMPLLLLLFLQATVSVAKKGNVVAGERCPQQAPRWMSDAKVETSLGGSSPSCVFSAQPGAGTLARQAKAFTFCNSLLLSLHRS